MGMTRNKKIFLLFFAAVCLVFLQRFAVGISYHPVMDDWFLYGDIYINKWTDFILPNEKFSIRPLAGVADMLFVSPLFKHLWAAELILTIVMIAGVFLILDTLIKNDFSAGGLFILILCMLPMNMEATYWIAASVRNSFSLFFTGVSLFLLQKYCDADKRIFATAYFVIGFGAVGFYEPAAAVYAFMSAYIIFKQTDKKKRKILLITLIHLAAIAVYYILNKSSLEIEARGHILTSGIIKHTIDITRMEGEILTKLNMKSLVSGLKNGLNIISENKLILQISAVIVFSVLFAVLCVKTSENKRRFSIKKVICGFALSAAGLAVFYLLADTRFTIRASYFSMIGISIIIEEMFMIIPFRQRRAVTAVVSAVCAFVFAASGIGQAQMYRKTSLTDTDIVNQMLELDTEGYITNVNKNTYLLGAVSYYNNVDSVEWFESIRAAAGGYADITGVMRHITGVSDTNNIMPVKDGDIINLGIYNASPQKCIFFALDGELKVHNAYLREYENGFEISYADGEAYGYLNRAEENNYILEIKKTEN